MLICCKLRSPTPPPSDLVHFLPYPWEEAWVLRRHECYLISKSRNYMEISLKCARVFGDDLTIHVDVRRFSNAFRTFLCPSRRSTCTNPIIHRFYPPKFCIIIVCNFSWDMKMSQGKSKTMPINANFLGGRSGALWYCASRELENFFSCVS